MEGWMDGGVKGGGMEGWRGRGMEAMDGGDGWEMEG